ncbi:MAG: hypothetical protein K0Q94_3682 [Paenibacillus sp.]|nr:hypothetical protein [Paenibacillus sp.]
MPLVFADSRTELGADRFLRFHKRQKAVGRRRCQNLQLSHILQLPERSNDVMAAAVKPGLKLPELIRILCRQRIQRFIVLKPALLFVRKLNQPAQMPVVSLLHKRIIA